MGEGSNLKSEKDVEEILKLAVRKGGDTDCSLRQRLEASANELGISDEALAEAEKEYGELLKQKELQAKEKKDRRSQIFQAALPAFMVLLLILLTAGPSQGKTLMLAPMMIMLPYLLYHRRRRRSWMDH